jgi:hypothetical protein
MTRERLPNRRESEIFRFEFAGIKHHCSLSRYDDGRPAEIFIDAGKVNTGVQNIMRDSAIVISLALQFGAPVETLRHAMTRTDTEEPASALGTLLDLIVEGKA